MKIVNLILAVMFLVFAFVQINDPDPLHWIIIYGAMAAICVLAAFHYYPKAIILILFVAFAGYSLVFLQGTLEWFAQDDKAVIFDDLAKMQYPYVEESREFLGLWVCNIVLIIQWVMSRNYPTRYF